MSTESNWTTVLIQEYEEGADDVEVCAALRLSREDFDNYYKDNAAFRELVDIGRMASSAWWRRTARKAIFRKDFNTAVWSFTMKNRFGWAEKSESVNSDVPNQQKNVDELRNEILARLPELSVKLGAVKKVSDLAIIPEGKNAKQDD